VVLVPLVQKVKPHKLVVMEALFIPLPTKALVTISRKALLTMKSLTEDRTWRWISSLKKYFNNKKVA
jgi:hypothetical protein